MCNGKHFYSLLIPAVSTVSPTGNDTVWEKSTLPTHPCIHPLLATFSWSAPSAGAAQPEARRQTHTHTHITNFPVTQCSCTPLVLRVLTDHPLDPPLVSAAPQRLHGAVLLNSKTHPGEIWLLKSLSPGNQSEGLIKRSHTYHTLTKAQHWTG